MARVVAVAVSLLGLLFALPTVARAAPPACPDLTLEIAPGETAELPAPPCTGLVPPITIVIPPGGGPQHGTLTAGDPNIYQPDAGFHGQDEFRYQVANSTGELSNIATVTVIVDNDPRCNSAAVTVPANVATVLPDLVCTDADNDLLTLGTGNPAHGTLVLSGGKLVYTPAPGYSGPDSFIFWAEDAFYSSPDATMSITVTPPPAPTPIATVMPPPPPPKDVTAPALRIKNASKKRSLAVTLDTNEAASATVTAALDKATARKLKLAQQVASLKATLKPGATTLKLKLSAKAAKAFKKRKSVKLTVTAVITDAAGNTTTKTLKVTLKQ
jgi:hypothetical protein